MKFKPEIKVGLFALAAIAALVYGSLKVGDQSVVIGGGYRLEAEFRTVAGLRTKAPIEMAGVAVGVVRDVALTDGQPKVVMQISKRVLLHEGTRALLRTRGFLGDTYIELKQGDPTAPLLKPGTMLQNSEIGGDINDLVNRFSGIAEDVRGITTTAKDSTMPNLDEFVRVMKEMTLRNEQNFDKIAQNLAALTDKLREVVEQGGDNAKESVQRIASIAKKIDEGRGTIGKLVNDEQTVQKLNDAVDSLNNALGSFNRTQFEIGYHTEYLGATEDFKHYISLGVKPAPDKAFLFDVVEDPNPSRQRRQSTTDITTGGTTTTVATETATLERQGVQFSAQLAKKFYDLTLRGGMIESRGGLGFDYDVGPMAFSFSAFDFQNDFGEKPHLKVYGTLNLTQNFFLVGGADDPLNRQQKTDYFGGVGFRLVDEDVKSILRLGSLGSLAK